MQHVRLPLEEGQKESHQEKGYREEGQEKKEEVAERGAAGTGRARRDAGPLAATTELVAGRFASLWAYGCALASRRARRALAQEEPQPSRPAARCRFFCLTSRAAFPQ